MTRWYARYADSFAKMQREIEAERLDQQSEIMARIYNKIANKERIGGGKAKVVADNMAKMAKAITRKVAVTAFFQKHTGSES